jgi:quinol monooxygenase YgiN
MTRYALSVELIAKSGKEEAVAAFLAGAAPLVNAEPATITWFAARIDHKTFIIFDAFDDEAGRDAHLNGRVAEALMANAAELLAVPPQIHKAEILAEKLPR